MRSSGLSSGEINIWKTRAAFVNFPLFFFLAWKPKNKQKEQTAVVLSDLRLTPELRRLPNWNSFTRREMWEEKEGITAWGGFATGALDLGAVPNLLIQTVGEIILEIIRAGDDVFIAAQRPWLGQGGRRHSTFLARSLSRIQRQIRRILRLLFGQL